MPTINGRACVANGRNLLLGSRDYNGDQWSDLQSISGTYKGVSIVSASNNGVVFNYNKSGLVSDNKINISDTYVLSMYVKNTSSAEITITFYGGSTNQNNAIVSKVGSESDWVMISKKISFWTTGGNSLIGIGLQGIIDNSVLISCIKLEKGTTATPLTPAPVDKVFSNGKLVYGRNLVTGTSNELKTVTGSGWGGSLGSPASGTYGAGKYYSSAYIENTTPAQLNIFIHVNGHAGNFSGSTVKAGKSGIVSCTFDILDGQSLESMWVGFSSPQTESYTYKYKEMMVTRTPSPWSPAPEDVLK